MMDRCTSSSVRKTENGPISREWKIEIALFAKHFAQKFETVFSPDLFKRIENRSPTIPETISNTDL